MFSYPFAEVEIADDWTAKQNQVLDILVASHQGNDAEKKSQSRSHVCGVELLASSNQPYKKDQRQNESQKNRFGKQSQAEVDGQQEEIGKGRRQLHTPRLIKYQGAEEDRQGIIGDKQAEQNELGMKRRQS